MDPLANTPNAIIIFALLPDRIKDAVVSRFVSETLSLDHIIQDELAKLTDLEHIIIGLLNE